MAFQIFWKIPFKSLRTGTLYTVNIYKDGALPSGYPLTLKGGAQPFVTEEDSDEDMFTPIRTQTGYLRFVDDGKAEDSSNQPQEVPFDWKDLIPATDTARPVTLTHQSGGQTIVDWQGFMQAQDFGSTLYGNPQEREFPIQCVLSVTQGTDINYQQTQIQNFAYLLKQIVDSIPSAQRPTSFMIQGGADAQAWLLKKIDWQNFVSEDGDGNLVARFSMYQCLEDMCRFWGWTARTCGRTLYLTMADDATTEPNWLSLTYNNLITMAGGTAAGTTSSTFSSATLTGDIFANTSQNEYVQRGHNKAVVTAETNRGDDDIFNVFDSKCIKAMQDLGIHSLPIHNVFYTDDLLVLNRNFWNLTCREGYASLNIGQLGRGDDAQKINVIRIKKTGGTSVTPFVTMETVYAHNFSAGFLMLFGTTYRFADKYVNPYNSFSIGNNFMLAKIGIGSDRSHAKWWNGYTKQWESSVVHTRIGIGNDVNFIDKKDEFPFWFLKPITGNPNNWWATNILTMDGMKGKLFFDLLGTDDDDLSNIDGEKSFELCDFNVTFQRNAGVTKEKYPSDQYKVKSVDRPTDFAYKASNGNSVSNEWNADCIYATENACKFCYGEIFNDDGSLITSVSYGSNDERPEQHLADRVVKYWQTSKRRLEVELRSEQIADITPQYNVTLDGTTGYPIAISHDWWNDITTLTILEL